MVDAAGVKKVLVLSSTVGSGHDAMARAIIRELAETHPEIETKLLDGLDVVKPGLASKAAKQYEASVNRLGGLGFTAGYRLTDTRAGAALVRKSFALAAEQPVADAVRAYDPDIVISTYPFIGQVVARASRNGRLGDVHPVMSLIDADPHASWLAKGNEVTASMFPADTARVARRDLQGATRTMRTVRPPVDPARFEGFDRTTVRQQFGLPTDRPVVLVSGGSLGLGMDRTFVQKLIDANPDVTYAIIAGKNDGLARQVAASFSSTQAVAIPYTDQMPALLATSDAAITNSGGMTTIEAFAAGTPVILHNVVPGHGVDSATALKADGLASYARTTSELRAALSSVGAADGRLARQATTARTTLFDRSTPTWSDVVESVGQGKERHSVFGGLA